MNDIVKKVEYQRRLQNSYQVITCACKELESMYNEMKMMKKNTIPHLLPVELELSDGLEEYWYDITNCQSVKEVLENGEFSKKELHMVLCSLGELLDDMEQYLLGEDDLMIDFDSIYFNKNRSDVFFTYLPAAQFESGSCKKQMLDFLDTLVRQSDYKDSEYINYLYSVNDILRNENMGIKQLLEEDDLRTDKNVLRDKPKMMEKVEESEAQEVSDKLNTRKKEKRVEKDEKPKKKKRTIKTECDETEEKESGLAFANRETLEQIKKKLLTQGVLGDVKKYKEEKNQKEAIRNTTEVKSSMCPILRYVNRKKPDILLQKDKYLLGKKEKMVDICLPYNSVSRIHAIIEQDGQEYYLADMNSLGGTFLNGSRLEAKEKVKLKNQDLIGIGGLEFTYIA